MSLRIKKPITFLATFVVASFLLYVTAAPLAQEGGPPPSQKSKEHEWIAKDAGTWKAEGACYSPQGDLAITGKETVAADCGGLWVFSTFEGEFMGAPFKGRSVTGYDPDAKKFVGAWVDSMTPRIIHLAGSIEGDALVMHTEGIDPVTGAKFPEKHVTRRDGDDKRVFEIWRTDAGEQLMLKIVYARTK